jgi:hypothetical protein
MKKHDDRWQHDDHCWVTFYGKAWKIHSIRWPLIYLWRAYEPFIERTVVDMRDFRVDEYCTTAAEWLSHPRRGRR